MEALLEWSRGPLFRLSFLIMVLGLLRHLLVTIVGVIRTMRNAGDKDLPYKQIVKATLSWLFPIAKVRDRFLYSITSILFHVGLILVPIFYSSHIILWDKGIGISWKAIPQSIADILTIVTIVTAIILFMIRVFEKTSRELSRFQDYILLILLAIPFITGYVASHPHVAPFSYLSIMLIHVLSANLIMLLVPFTKMSHVILLPTTQLVAEVGWHFPEDMGERVAVLLEKENQPI